MCIFIFSKSVKKKYYVHRLVAINFISNPQNYKEINHIDENKTNNRVENLEWCSKQYNANFGTRKQRISEHNTNKQSVCQYDLQGNLIAIYDTIKQAAITTGIRKSGISNCCANRYSNSGGYIWRYNNE